MASMIQHHPGHNHVKSTVPPHGCVTATFDIARERYEIADELRLVMSIEPRTGRREPDRCST